VKPQLSAGRTPAELVRACPFFQKRLKSLRRGEISGKLDETLRRLYTYIRRKARKSSRAVATWTPR